MYFCRTVKDDMFDIIVSAFLSQVQHQGKPLIKSLRETLRRKFLRTFGYSAQELRQGMKLRYFYTKDCSITVRLITSRQTDRKILNVEVSPSLVQLINDYEARITAELFRKKKFADIMYEMYSIFNDKYHIIYLPSGRSMLAVLSNYIRPFNVHGDTALDYCTQKYLEDLSAIKSDFTGGLEGLIDYYRVGSNVPQLWETAQELIGKVICGKYTAGNGEERIIFKDGESVGISFASSGQQDALWITNLLFYYLVRRQPAMFIIEEPESHLFPSSQKYITELISLVCNSGSSILVTTHSPYVLGAMNNLLYASSFRKSARQKAAAEIIPSSLWIAPEKFSAYFIKEGMAEDCIDSDTKLIQNERIDEISEVITDDFEALSKLKYEESEYAAE